MINRLRTLHQVCQDITSKISADACAYCWAIELFMAAPRNTDVAHHKMALLDWEVLQDLEFILEVSPYDWLL